MSTDTKPGYPHSSTVDLFTPLDKVLRMRSIINLDYEICVRDNYLGLHIIGGTKDNCDDCVRLRKEIEQINQRLAEMEKREKDRGVQSLDDWSKIIMEDMRRSPKPKEEK